MRLYNSPIETVPSSCDHDQSREHMHKQELLLAKAHGAVISCSYRKTSRGTIASAIAREMESNSLVWMDCRYAEHVKIEDVTDTMGKKGH